MLLASWRHIKEIGPESNICCLTAFELFFFICVFLRSGIYPEFKNWQVLIIWIGITVQQGIHVPAELSLKANLYYQLYEMISRDCNVFQLQTLHLYCDCSSPAHPHLIVLSLPQPVPRHLCMFFNINTHRTTEKWYWKVESLTWIY